MVHTPLIATLQRQTKTALKVQGQSSLHSALQASRVIETLFQKTKGSILHAKNAREDPPPFPTVLLDLHQCLNKMQKCLVCAVPKYCWSYRAETGALPIRFGRRTKGPVTQGQHRLYLGKDVEGYNPRTEKGKGMGNVPFLAPGAGQCLR